ncbi:MAG: Lrp/AsnC family transcriptional regulator [Oscillospiraceae bacterium]|jgi:DNA-binding Lrp family transcriptional regulator|nr:Lrp/AsnC family transcriptional regulator [Oscillospiraceae bacterium]
MEKLVRLLRRNARLSDGELAAMLGITAEEVAAKMEKLEKDGIIVGYAAVINEEKLNEAAVSAFIEVKVTPKAKYGYNDIAEKIAQFDEVESVRLMSGAYDLAVTVKCASVAGLGKFVQERIAPLDGVLSTATHFVIGRYKEMGAVIGNVRDEREPVTP